MNWDFLKSRAFWTALGPFVMALCALIGVSDEKTTAIVTLITAFAGFWGVTLTRARSGEGKSYAEVMRILKRQDDEIKKLRGGAL